MLLHIIMLQAICYRLKENEINRLVNLSQSLFTLNEMNNLNFMYFGVLNVYFMIKL